MRQHAANVSPAGIVTASALFVPFDPSEIEQSIAARFERQVRARADHVALKTTSESLTYAALNRWANHVAQSVLAAVGEGNEPVALCVRRETLAIAAILGLLKAGKIYVPLDPGESADRHKMVLDESGATLVLVDGAADAFDRPDVRVLNLNDIDRAPELNDPRLHVPPDALAYIFYTSGSTGRPKGVVDSHRNVLHNVMRYTNSLKIAPSDRLTLLQSFTFSGSVSSLFCALLNGATSYPFDVKREGPNRLVALLADESITMYHSVPSLFRLVAEGGREYPALRVIRLEGDRARPADIELFKSRLTDDCILVNGLGATECGLVRQFFVDHATPTPTDVVPIGQPVEGMRIMLLDESGEEVAPGAIGEIAVESDYLAVGYWRRPDLTEAAFRPSPRGPGMRIYRTGDLGRMGPGGCLDYLGRAHFQMKLHGRWVDAAAVERALLELGWFKESIVHAREGPGGEPSLAAYCVPVSERPSVNEVRRALAQRVPAYIVPASVVYLDRLPLDANGKVDRKSLPPPTQRESGATGRDFAPPQNMLQIQLQRIWRSVLRVDRVGIRDEFFELGGDSLAALNMLLAVERATERTIPPDVLLAGPTIERLAEHIARGADVAARPIVEIQAGGARRPFYFLHGDYESGGFYALKIARALGGERPFYAMPPCGANGCAAPPSYAEMAAIHLAALRARQPSGPYLLGGTCNGGLVAYEMARLLAHAGERIDLLVLIGSSARNLRFRSMRRLLAPLCGVDPGGAAFERRLCGGIARLHHLWAKFHTLPPREQTRFMRSRLGKGLELIRYVAKGDRNGRANGGSLYPLYQRIDQEYVPGRYGGRVTLFLSRGEIETLGEAVRWWRMVAGSVELHVLPASPHQEALAAHPQAVGAMLRSCIETAERASSPDVTRAAAPRLDSSARP